VKRSATKIYISLAISGPQRRTFTYHTDADTFSRLTPGARVTAPFGKKTVVGFFLAEVTKPPFATKAIETIVDTPSLFENRRLTFYRWLSDYYFANPADTLALALPPKSRGLQKPVLLLKANSDIESARRELLDYGTPERIVRRLCDGKALRPRDIKELDSLTVGGVQVLIRNGALESRLEMHSATGEQAGRAAKSAIGRLRGYVARDKVAVATCLAGTADNGNSLTLSEGVIERKRLLDAGLSAYRIQRLVADKALEPVYGDLFASVVNSLSAREDVDALQMNAEQQTVFEQVAPTVGVKFAPFLLHGVTGSGKTLVYCHLIREALKKHRGALVLAPEIALAGEVYRYIRGFFAGADIEIGFWHSGLTAAQRQRLWLQLAAGEVRVLIGPRSALFAPLQNPGVIIVDEEHDDSYKQSEPAPRFHGRDSAIMFAKLSAVPVILGSGTPSVESYFNAKSGRYTLLELTARPSGAKKPSITLIDMNKERLAGEHPFVSLTLKKEVESRLQRGEQVILYLNRRGFAPRVQCSDCGSSPECPDCATRLTFHKRNAQLICHLCGYMLSDYRRCDSCGSEKLRYVGAGTQKLEESVGALFAGARCVRLDSDVTNVKGAAWDIFRDFAAGKYNLLIGTQMISKGIDFPNVTLVGAIFSDHETLTVDFRTAEKTFARLTQVAGRAGRTGRTGRIGRTGCSDKNYAVSVALAQTYNPQSEIMQAVAHGDYQAFYQTEITPRKQLEFPPFCRIIRVIVSSTNEALLSEHALRLRSELDTRLESFGTAVRILGPAPCQLYRIRGRFRRHILLYTKKTQAVVDALSQWEERQAKFGLPASVRIAIDVDPVDFL